MHWRIYTPFYVTSYMLCFSMQFHLLDTKYGNDYKFYSGIEKNILYFFPLMQNDKTLALMHAEIGNTIYISQNVLYFKTASKISMSVNKQNIFILKTSFYVFSGRSLSTDIKMSTLYNIQQNIHF